MRQVSLAFSLVLLLCIVDSLAGATVVNSTFLGGDHYYSKPGNWSPAEVPNNSGDKSYDVAVPSYVYLDIDATVSNLTISGQFLSVFGRSYVVTGMTTLDTKSGLLRMDFGAFRIGGALSNFDSTTKTLTSGKYEIVAGDGPGGAGSLLQFPGADIVTNGASISLFGSGAVISDSFGADALRNFRHNLANGSFTIAGRDYTISNAFTNDGTLGVAGGQLAAGSLRMAGGLTNYDPQTMRISGGVYQIVASSGSTSGIPPQPARLIVPGADIVRNSATISLAIQGNGSPTYKPSFTDENGNDALRNFSENETAGVFQLTSVSHQLASDFTNAGTVEIYASSLSLPSSHVYRQAGGRTTLSGGGITGNVEIVGGQLSGYTSGSGGRGDAFVFPVISGNVIVGTAILEPAPLRIDGALQLSDSSRFLFRQAFPTSGLTVQSTFSIAGTLEIGNVGSSSSATYTIAHAAAISGVFKNAPNGSRVTTLDGKGSLVVNYSATDVTLSNYQPTAPNPRLMNISARAQVLTGDEVAIGGFIVTGSASKNVVIRALGPSLAQAGVTAPLQDPMIELHDGKGAIVTTNDNWQDTQRLELNATSLAPTDARESAIFATLSPGAYTAVVRGKNDSTGVTLIEAYDLSSGSPAKLANISTRGFVDANHVLIGGLIAGGNAPDTVHVVVRAIGRGLEANGVQNFLPDASLEVRDHNGALVAANDDFGTPAENQVTVPMAFRPSNATDAATGLTVASGNYTVIVSGKNGANGNALVEIYDLND